MWVKLSDNIGTHPKLLAVGAEAAWLWVASIAYANAHITDGRLPKKSLRAFYPCDDWTAGKLRVLAERLVSAGLWEEIGQDFWKIHDYSVYQEQALSDRIAAKREWERKRKASNRAASKGVSNSRVSADLRDLSHRDTPGTNAGQSLGHVPPNVPRLSHPVPVVSHAPGPTRITEGLLGASTPALVHPRGDGPVVTDPDPQKAFSSRIDQEGPESASESTGRVEGRTAASDRPERASSARQGRLSKPGHMPPPSTGSAPAQSVQIVRDCDSVNSEPSDAFRAYLAAHWPDKIDVLSSPGLLAEYVGENFRRLSGGVFQPGASAQLLTGFGNAIVSEKLTRAEVREMAAVLKVSAKEVFPWDKTGVVAGGPVTLSLLMGKATRDSGRYEARQFTALCGYVRKRLADRAAKSAPPVQEEPKPFPFGERPATISARPHAEPTVVTSEIAAAVKTVRDSLLARKAERDAMREASNFVMPVDQASLEALYASAPVLGRAVG